MDSQDQKREQIIEAAIKRFAHFGLNKTTMNEIASDLNFSKALLYYYFPDKLSVYAAALDKIINEIIAVISTKLSSALNTDSAVKIYIDARQEFLEKYFTLFDFNKLLNIDKYQDLKKILDHSNQSEIKHLKTIIKIGVKTGKYQVDDIDTTAQILFDAILGIRTLYLTNTQVQFGISKEFIETISERQKQLMLIFLKGLEC